MSRRNINSLNTQYGDAAKREANEIINNTELENTDPIIQLIMVLKRTIDDLIYNDIENENIVGKCYYHAADTTGLTDSRSGTTGRDANGGLGIQWSEQIKSGNDFTTSGENITIRRTGIYKIDMNVTTLMTSADNRTESAAVLQTYDSARRTWNDVPGTKMHMYNRLNGYERTTGSSSCILSLTDGQQIRLRYWKVAGPGIIGCEPNSSAITITNLT